MRRFFQSPAIGKPQFAAAGLLFLYLLQCLWLVRVEVRNHGSPDFDRTLRIYLGLLQWRGGIIAGTPESLRTEALSGETSSGRIGRVRAPDGFDIDHSPLYYLTAGAPFVTRPSTQRDVSLFAGILAATPYLFFGVMLGGSLWYVTRRLYGNAGGFIALLLYCFSPAMIMSAAGTHTLGETGAVWGAFGAVWTGIAVAHTLYAPREVVLWNWRRILLLGLSLALAAGNQFGLGVLAFVVLILMLWVAPVRTRAVIAIWSAAVAVALAMLFAAYFFHPPIMWHGLMHARWIEFEPRAFAASFSYVLLAQFVFRSNAAMLLILPAGLIAFCVWKRTRYFGNSAPLAVAALLIALGIAAPEFPGYGFQLAAFTFLFVFVAGVFADLLETRRGQFVMAGFSGLLLASAVWNVTQLAKLASR